MMAEEKAKPAEKKEAAAKDTVKDAKAAAKDAGTEEAKSVHTDKGGFFPDKEFYTKEEVEALRTVLDQKSNQLDHDIENERKYVESLRGQTEDHLKKIEAARNEIADFMNTRDDKEEGKLKKLAKFYEAMDAEQAAPLLKDVQDDLAIKIFDRMDAKKAGTILAQLPANRAARLTSQFPRLKLQVERSGSEVR